MLMLEKSILKPSSADFEPKKAYFLSSKDLI
jgi:hypothetical protein